jgi:uncharacterized protein (DUF924 family)
MYSAAAHEVLDFWFGAPGSVDYGKPREAWFKKSDDFDARIRERFLRLHERAQRVELDSWRDSPLTLLALIIVLDQFPRNMFRNSPRAFAADPLARELARHALERGYDRQVPAQERGFFYLPFMHSEALPDQETCLALYEALGNPEGVKYAELHADIIRRFGRFPHRNPVLGRKTTDEEKAFLDGGGFAG